MNSPQLNSELQQRYFISYSGVSLPLQLVNELDEESLGNRITYFVAYYDQSQRLVKIEKVVYGEIEFVHRYEYSASERLSKATIVEDDDDPRVLVFDEQGMAREI